MIAEYILTKMGHSSIPNGRSRVGIGKLLSDMVDGDARSGFNEGAWVLTQIGRNSAGKFGKGETTKRTRRRICREKERGQSPPYNGSQ